MAQRFDKLRPPAIISTVGSLRRRFESTFTPTPTAEPDDVAKLVGDDGRSMLDIVATATKILTEARHEISVAANRDNPSVSAKAIDPSLHGPGRASGSREEELDKLEAAADQMGEVLSVMSGKDWGRVASIDGGGEATVEKLGQCLAKAAIAELDTADALGKTY